MSSDLSANNELHIIEKKIEIKDSKEILLKLIHCGSPSVLKLKFQNFRDKIL